MSAHTNRAYRRQVGAYTSWLGEHAGVHPDAYTDLVGAEAAVTAWRRDLLQLRRAPSTIKQALAAVDLLSTSTAPACAWTSTGSRPASGRSGIGGVGRVLVRRRRP
ncbi:hypothetical protein [Actinoplanes awajinensis]|uniref:Core-binding (CB) domain-containing protein n=1 Tax=Actinoplanes awajinensis subsp. mycoplanecinus TaxID=135947 RepID=A0A101JJ11_9ACTN|nr:hypothetical protein [Actinoplanes awajinensis]KUL27755.1 hypothetical protein ADL15_33475 [Actinoplanes awajinensis subsp. mycoplanecinus]